MWIVHAYVAVVLSCAPGAPDSACTRIVVPGFVDVAACEVSVGRIAQLMSTVIADGKKVLVRATCEPVKPPREA